MNAGPARKPGVVSELFGKIERNQSRASPMLWTPMLWTPMLHRV